MFVSGRLGSQLKATAGALSREGLAFPIVIAGGSGVLSERGEIEGEDAAAGIVWSGGRAEVFALETKSKDVALGDRIATWLATCDAPAAASTLLFAKPQGFTPETFGPLREHGAYRRLSGAGTVGEDGTIGVSADGRVVTGNIVSLVLRGVSPPVLKTAHPCRLLTPLLPITEAVGALVVKIAGRSALDTLSSAGASEGGQPLVMTLLSAKEQGEDPELLVRGVQGVDPGRGALLVSAEVEEGQRIAFGVRDPAIARTQLTARLREAARDTAGASPQFGLYFNCSGRGSSMYGSLNVDSRLVKDRFRTLPFCGLNSSFEIGQHDGGPALHLYTGVLTLFSALS